MLHPVPRPVVALHIKALVPKPCRKLPDHHLYTALTGRHALMPDHCHPERLILFFFLILGKCHVSFLSLPFSPSVTFSLLFSFSSPSVAFQPPVPQLSPFSMEYFMEAMSLRYISSRSASGSQPSARSFDASRNSFVSAAYPKALVSGIS